MYNRLKWKRDSARSFTKIRYQSLFKNKEIYFHSIVYVIYVMSNLHTHAKCFVWGCKVFWFKKGR